MISLIEGNEIGDKGAKEIGLALQKNKTLATLGLCSSVLLLLFIGQNNISDEGAKEIGIALQNNNTLTTLDLGISFYQCHVSQKEMKLEIKEQRKSGLHCKRIRRWLRQASVVQCYCYSSQGKTILVTKEQRKSELHCRRIMH
eukprot:TRINITY_DN535_c0_g1_i1.p1 TRINITY_DN535_c0_g1~~TRINITY_DN535_c0_g1_i1.p1  ORF type:complete len:163 (+),score=10.06 TRINITY_DN535_c0_g1_i1:63-491(+)